jgi:hypothetical protein
MFAMLVLLVFSAGISSCSGSNAGGSVNSGTTPGSYKVTVTGVSGTITQSGSFSLTVQ